MHFLLMIVAGVIAGCETTGAMSFLFPDLQGEQFWSFMLRTVALGSSAGVALVAARDKVISFKRAGQVLGAWLLAYIIGIPTTWLFMMSWAVGGPDLQPYKPLLFWSQFFIALCFLMFISNPKYVREE